MTPTWRTVVLGVVLGLLVGQAVRGPQPGVHAPRPAPSPSTRPAAVDGLPPMLTPLDPLEFVDFPADYRDRIVLEHHMYSASRDRYLVEVLPVLDLQPGMVVADVGCGGGFWSFVFARLVGNHGKVLAIDADPSAVHYVMEMAQRHGAHNVFPQRTMLEDAGLSPDSVDLEFLCGIHYLNFASRDLADPVEWLWERRRSFLENLYLGLRPKGRLVIMEVSKEDSPDSALDLEQFQRLVEKAGFRRESARVVGTDYLMSFTKSAATGRSASSGRRTGGS